MINGTQLSWDDTVALAQLLRENHCDVPLDNISIGEIYQWVIELPQFCDDPKIANDEILLSILTEWIEEV